MGKVEFDEAGKPYIMVPWRIRRGGGHTLIVEAGGGIQEVASNPLPKAIILAHQYAEMLESGKYATVLELSKKLHLDRSYVAKTLSLVNLAPDIVEAIMTGEAPESLTLRKVSQGFPEDWDEQRELFGMK